MTTYHVAMNGDNKNDGSAERPWGTLTYAAGQVKRDDIVVVHDGVYHEAITIKTPGTIWVAANRHKAILDGRYTPEEKLANGNMPAASAKKSYLPGSDYGKMLDIRAEDVTFDGFVIRHVAGQPVGLMGNRAKLLNCILDFAYGGGLMAEGIESPLVENVQMYRCNQKRYDPTNTRGGPANVQVNLLFKRVRNGVIRGCEIAYNHGEGIALAVESSGCLVEGNTVHTNLHMHIVINHAQDNTIRANFIYHSNDAEFVQRKSGDPPTGIAISDELQRGEKLGLKRSSGNVIVNNIVAGMGVNFVARVSKNAIGALRRTYVGFNTFVNARKENGTPVGVRIPPSAEHEGSVFENNIIVQGKGAIIKAPGGKGVQFQHNLWSRKPPAAAAGEGDQVGDPHLLDADAPLVDGYGTNRAADPRYYQLTAQSRLAIGKAKENGLHGPLTDFFGHQRNASDDIGACGYFGVVEPGPVPEPEPQPDPSEDWRVHFSDEELALIDHCRVYAAEYPDGLAVLTVPARLAELLSTKSG